MSEGFDETPQEAIQTEPGQRADEEQGTTGNANVDAVLESLERLEGAPVADHVAVFEAAHEKLRGALSDAGNDQQVS